MSGPWNLEPAALIPGVTISHDLQTQILEAAVPLSIAISVKRIADALDGTTMGVDISESIAGLTHALIYQRTK